MYPTGQEECEGLDGGNLPEYTIACRAMMFIALALCIGSIMMYFIGSAHTVCMYRDRKATSKKAKIVVYSGALAIVYSLFCLIAAIMYRLCEKRLKMTEILKIFRIFFRHDFFIAWESTVPQTLTSS